MRIAVGGMKQETNSFSPIPSPRPSWSTLIGNQILNMRGVKKNLGGDIGGILVAAAQYGWEIIPTFYAQCMPAAPTDYTNYQWMKEQILKPIRENDVDGVILCLHGAMMAEGVDDPEADLISAVREIIGTKPLMVTLDLHGNISEYTAKHVDAAFGFDTNPHIDEYDRALECTACMEKTLSKQWKPVTAHRHPPLVFPTINMLTTRGPMVKLFERAREWESKSGMINVSVFGGFPYVDADYTGFSVVATADNDEVLAQAACDDICALAWEIRNEFIKEQTPVEVAIEKAQQLLAENPTLPVILADVADNAGGGGSGETTILLQAMIDANLPGSAAATIWDPETVQQAIAVGVGNTGHFSIGGKACADFGAPVEIDAKVKSIIDAKFPCYGPLGLGDLCDFGTGVRLQVGNVNIAVYTVRHPCNHIEQFTSLGIEPTRQRLLLVKSRGHFRADFEPISSHIVEVDAPGAANPNILRYRYQAAYGWPITPSVQEWSPK